MDVSWTLWGEGGPAGNSTESRVFQCSSSPCGALLLRDTRPSRGQLAQACLRNPACPPAHQPSGLGRPLNRPLNRPPATRAPAAGQHSSASLVGLGCHCPSACTGAVGLLVRQPAADMHEQLWSEMHPSMHHTAPSPTRCTALHTVCSPCAFITKYMDIISATNQKQILHRRPRLR